MKIDFSDDKTLKNELEKGNHQALVFLMDKYHHPLCLHIYSLSNNYEGAQDIVQNVFLKLWENKSKTQSIKSIKNYLYRTSYNGFIDYWRKDKKMLSLEKIHLETLNTITEDNNEPLLKKQISLVKREIQKLPPKCKETFLLSKKEGLTNLEIASILNVSVRTVESHINKAFKILRKKLQNKTKTILFYCLDLTNKSIFKIRS
ncbi:MAG: sigma-70 family RNA polymerase sigma factor [Cellulophaga sp.]